jgi:hypothetical protein
MNLKDLSTALDRLLMTKKLEGREKTAVLAAFFIVRALDRNSDYKLSITTFDDEMHTFSFGEEK